MERRRSNLAALIAIDAGGIDEKCARSIVRQAFIWIGHYRYCTALRQVEQPALQPLQNSDSVHLTLQVHSG